MKTIGIVSLSRGILGEPFLQHEVTLGLRRMEAFGWNVKFLPHARMGLAQTTEHPEQRAEDLLAAFCDPEIDAILCAIGGDDTYRLAPFLFEDDRLARAVRQNPKPFLGFSDTTLNHFMLHKAGLPTFYGQAFLPDVCELEPEMLSYTKQYFEEWLRTGTIREIHPSDVWYESRTDFSPAALGTMLPRHKNAGFELLQGAPRFSGKILGGCLDSMFDMFSPERYEDMPQICKTYGLFPALDDWRGKILLLETCEEKMKPEKYERAVGYLKETGIFGVLSGVLVGKPMDEAYDREYRALLLNAIADPDLPVLCNLNIGHALPRCILPFGAEAHVDADAQIIRFGTSS